MGWLSRLSLESGFACRDFPARRNEFPVPDHRESVAMTAERLRNLGAESARSVQFRRISLYFPCRTGIPAIETSSLSTAPTAIQSAGAETFRAQPGAVREISAIPRGLGGQALACPNRRLRVPAPKNAAARAFLCCQVGRFGFALDSPQQLMVRLSGDLEAWLSDSASSPTRTVKARASAKLTSDPEYPEADAEDGGVESSGRRRTCRRAAAARGELGADRKGAGRFPTGGLGALFLTRVRSMRRSTTPC